MVLRLVHGVVSPGVLLRRGQRARRLSQAAALGLALVLTPGRPARAVERADVDRVMSRFTVASRVGPLETPLPIDVADFLLDHPDLAASIVRGHKLAPYTILMRGPRQSWADDGEGTQGLITLVELGPGRRVYYGEGAHTSGIFPEIRAEAVIVMTMQSVARPGAPPAIVSAFEVYIRLRNPVLAGLVKVLRPFLRDTAARKFSKAFLVADKVGRLLAEDPAAVAADVRAYPGLLKADRARLLALLQSMERP